MIHMFMCTSSTYITIGFLNREILYEQDSFLIQTVEIILNIVYPIKTTLLIYVAIPSQQK